MDSNYNLKIADFGWAGPSDGKHEDQEGKKWLSTYCGTLLYMAPEVHQKDPYEGKPVDVFAAGVIMFIMASGTHPF